MVETKVESNGEIVIPGELTRKLGFQPGDPLRATIEAGKIVLFLEPKRQHVGKIIDDPITGLPVIDFGPDAPTLIHEGVLEVLADVP